MTAVSAVAWTPTSCPSRYSFLLPVSATKATWLHLELATSVSPTFAMVRGNFRAEVNPGAPAPDSREAEAVVVDRML